MRTLWKRKCNLRVRFCSQNVTFLLIITLLENLFIKNRFLKRNILMCDGQYKTTNKVLSYIILWQICKFKVRYLIIFLYECLFFFSSLSHWPFIIFLFYCLLLIQIYFIFSTKQVKESWIEHQLVESAIVYEEWVDLRDYDAIHYKDNTSHDQLEDKVHFKISPQLIKIASIAY